MKLMLTDETVSLLNEIYGSSIKSAEAVDWKIDLNSCGCSGDCGSNWQRS